MRISTRYALKVNLGFLVIDPHCDPIQCKCP